MKGFIKCNYISKNLYANDYNYKFINHDDSEKYNKWNLLRKAGINPYPEFDFYVSNEFGAWMGNTSFYVKTVEDLLNIEQLDLDTYEVTPFIKYINEGYDLVIGPGVPETDGKIHGNGVYCKNWVDILNNNSQYTKKIATY